MRLDTLDRFTIEAWVRLDSTFQTGWPISYGGDSSGFGLFLFENLTPGFPSPMTIAAGDRNPSITGNSILPQLGEWVHIAVTKDDSLWKLYRNGMLVGRGMLTAPTGDGILRIGQFSGALQQLRIWSIARDEEAIRSDLYSAIPGTEQGLYASFSIDASTLDSITDPVHGFVFRRYGTIATITNTPGGLAFQSQRSPAIAWTSLPSHLQFVPRDASNYGKIVIAGAVLEAGYDSIIIEKFRDGQLQKRSSFALKYSPDSATFELQDSILAERSLYSYVVWCEKGSALFYEGEAADLTAGDVYIIDGQSNAHAAIAWFFWQSPFLRSFGVQTPNENFDTYDPADTSWGLANGNDWGLTYTAFTGPYMVGIWGMELQTLLLNNFGIPTCIINGAAGGSTIEQHARSNSNPENLQTVYGSLLYRVHKAGCQKQIKAIFWDQGEYNTAANYFENFKTLNSDWQQDYPAPASRVTYVLQVRPGCGPPGGSALREVQRRLVDSLPGIEVLSTVGIEGHDGCHYDAYGYVDIGDNLARLVARDYYGSSDTSEIDAPNVQSVFYANPDSSEIRIIMRRSDSLSIIDDTPLAAHPEAMSDYFYLDGESGAVHQVLPKLDTIELILNGHSTASYLNYLPDQNYSDTATVYEGPWIVNRRGIGVLTFDSIPIQGYHAPAGVASTGAPEPLRVSIARQSAVDLSVQFKLPTHSNANVTIYDDLGRIHQRTSVANTGPGMYVVPIMQNVSKVAGTYIATVRTEGSSGSAIFVLP